MKTVFRVPVAKGRYCLEHRCGPGTTLRGVITAARYCIHVAAWALGCGGVLCAQNLIFNGDFEQGNVGFSTGYIYSPGDIWEIGTYDVVHDVQDVHPLAVLHQDHTTGTGLLVAANGALPNLPLVWSQTVTHCSPPGDTCNDPKIIPALPYSDIDDSSNFLNDYDEACPYKGSTSADVVYRFVPDHDMSITATLCNDDTCYDTKVYIYEGSCPGTRIACNDDFCVTACFPYAYVSRVDGVPVLGGHSYYIIVDGYDGHCGQYHLTVTDVPPCPVECPPGSYLEQEPCGNDTNGGCNMAWPSFEVLPDIPPPFASLTVCGTLWCDGAIRDTDWYEIVLTQPAVVGVHGQGTVDNMVFGWLEQITPGVPGCANLTGSLNPYFVVGKCVEGWYSTGLCVPAGVYYLFAATDYSQVDPCPVDYVMTVQVNCYDPGGACCVNDVCTENQMWWICMEQGGTFFECQHCADLDPPCGPAMGACCYADGSCAVTTEADCAGTWQGLYTSCDPNPCEPVVGACCYADGACSVVMEVNCVGTWAGVGTDCCPNPCPQPASVQDAGAIVGWGNRVVAVDLGADFVKVASGLGHSVALKTDGSIVTWGSNEYGQCSFPPPNAGFVAIAGGGGHSLGVKADGSIVAWGHNSYGQCDVPAPNSGFVAVAGGGEHSLGLKVDGSIVAWGSNVVGQCNVPEPNADFVAVAAGSAHSLGLKSDGSLRAWGDNGYGQCDVPAPNSGFVAVAAGGGHSLGLKTDGSIVAWGGNWTGQCNVPEPNADFVAVAAGLVHSLGLKSDGSIVAWGYNSFGQCDVPAPNTGFVGIAGGLSHSVGLRADGSLAVWGDNSEGQCNGPTPNTTFLALAAGQHHSLGLRASGAIAAWGFNYEGQCSVPAPNADFVGLAGGDWHSLGLKADGSVVAWGQNDSGQCDVPAPNAGFTAVAGGGAHSLGRKADGSIVAWGAGPGVPPAPNADFVAIAAGGFHSLGLKADGSIVAWGDNSYGQCNVPKPNTGFVAVSAGKYHTLGLKANGSILAWGYNYYGQCDVPAPNTGFVAVTGGGYHSLGVKADGLLVAWGYNDYNQCYVPAPNSGFVAAAVCGDYFYAGHSLGLKAFYGDANCDGVVNFDDINPFTSTLWVDPLTWNLAHPGCHWLNADCNGDGVVNIADINPFVAILSGGG